MTDSRRIISASTMRQRRLSGRDERFRDDSFPSLIAPSSARNLGNRRGSRRRDGYYSVTLVRVGRDGEDRRASTVRHRRKRGLLFLPPANSAREALRGGREECKSDVNRRNKTRFRGRCRLPRSRDVTLACFTGILSDGATCVRRSSYGAPVGPEHTAAFSR